MFQVTLVWSQGEPSLAQPFIHKAIRQGGLVHHFSHTQYPIRYQLSYGHKVQGPSNIDWGSMRPFPPFFNYLI